MNSHDKFAKRILTVAFILIKLVVATVTESASADVYPQIEYTTLYQQAQVGWHNTYEAHGRTITVDVDAECPYVSKAPVLRVKRTEIPDEMLNAAVEAGIEKLDWGPLRFQRNAPYDALNGLSDAGAAEQYVSAPIDLDSAYAEDNLYSINDVSNWLKATAASIGVVEDRINTTQPKNIRTLRFRKGNIFKGVFDGEAITDSGFYNIRYEQLIGGITLYDNVKNSFRDLSEGTFWTDIDVTFQSTNSYTVYANLFDTVDTLYDDMPLCDFSYVVKAYEELIEKGLVRNVYELRFVYVVFYDPNDDDSYIAVPSWIMTCEIYPSAKKERPENFSGKRIETTDAYAFVVVNAQTGELLDPYQTRKNRANCPTIIEWSK